VKIGSFFANGNHHANILDSALFLPSSHQAIYIYIIYYHIDILYVESEAEREREKIKEKEKESK
jgi:hypothetical protein